MKYTNYLLLVLLLMLQVPLWAQQSAEQRAAETYFHHKYTEAKKLLQQQQQLSAFGLLVLTKAMQAEQQAKLAEQRYGRRLLPVRHLLDSLYTAHRWAEKAAEAYAALPIEEQKRVRIAASVSDEEAAGKLAEQLLGEAYEILNNAPYRKTTAQLYQAQLYNRVTEADTLLALRELLIEDADVFLDRFSESTFAPAVKQLQRELVKEFLGIDDLRQYGDRSGSGYEKHCRQILRLYEEEELAHVLPTFYGAEYDFPKHNWQESEDYQKLKMLADNHELSILELLCKLNLHYQGCTPASKELYADFVLNMAPADVALKALQKLMLCYSDAQVAAAEHASFAPSFPGRERYFEQMDELIRQQGQRYLKNLGEGVNSEAKDYSPVLSLDNNTLYFARKLAQTGEDIFVSKRQKDGSWGAARLMPLHLNTPSHEIPQGVAADGKELYIFGNYAVQSRYSYLQQQPVSLGKGDLYYSPKNEQGWGRVEVFPNPVNTPHYEANMQLTADGQAVLFSSDRPGAVGGYNPNYPPEALYHYGSGEFNTDLWVSEKTESGWAEPINLGEVINTKFAETKPFLHPDGKTLYFSSEGHYGLGGYDIFMSKRLSDSSWTQWSEPINLGRTINSPADDAITLSIDGETALVVAEAAADSYGREDIYELVVPEKLRPELVVLVRGQFKNALGQAEQVRVYWHKAGELEALDSLQTNQQGGFQLVLQPGASYFFYGDKEMHFSSSQEIDLQQRKAQVVSFDSVQVTSLSELAEEGAGFVMNSLHFDHDSERIWKSSYFDLQRLIKLLQLNVNLKLRIDGHTDSSASHEYNMALSERRVASVKSYLVEQGVQAARITTQAFGETQPVADNATEEGRLRNRRVEFLVFKE